jgi:predicted ATP-dependent endonuclease of OLD family
MRCIKVKLNGYKRLSDTSCNLDGRLIAFVGRNEAGKTSLLEALAWFSDEDDDALPATHVTHGKAVDDEDAVVEVTYHLGPEDKAALADLDLLEEPEWFAIERQRDGSYASEIRPEPRRNPEPILRAIAAIEASKRARPKQYDEIIEVETDGEVLEQTPRQWADLLIASLADPDTRWREVEKDAASRLTQWLLQETASGKVRDPKTSVIVRDLRRQMTVPHPELTARQRLQERMPKFVLFSSRDRQLPTASEIAQPAHRDALRGGVKNLVALASLDVEALADAIAQGHERASASALKQANRRLREVFSQAWNQYGITVALTTEGTQLKVMIDPDDDYADITPIHERSDGLKVFVALVALLTGLDHARRPILLVDEAETHLHFDAQADLLDVMSRYPNVEQVFYSTHSPGCLPKDLGRGIRVVKPAPDNDQLSVLSSVYWDDAVPGFSPLLMHMGAAGAAFSACRQAVVAEGASDMVLMPTLIRLALNVDDLAYQVAPGIAGADLAAADFDAVAAKVVFLTDGDADGHEYADTLRDDKQLPEDRVLSHGEGRASEDYLDPEFYLSVINAFLDAEPKITPADLHARQPVARSVSDWCRAHGLKAPGKRAVATHIVESPEKIQLRAGAADDLRQLHERIVAGLAIGHS